MSLVFYWKMLNCNEQSLLCLLVFECCENDGFFLEWSNYVPFKCHETCAYWHITFEGKNRSGMGFPWQIKLQKWHVPIHDER